MTDRIISLLPCTVLKERIHTTGFIFSDMSLLTIIVKCAPYFDIRLSMMEEFSKTASPEISKLTLKLIEVEKEKLKKLTDASENHEYIYELEISDDPLFGREKTVCSSYEAALKSISSFYKVFEEDGAAECPESKYIITKTKLRHGNESAEYFTLPSISGTFGPGKRLIRIDDNTIDCDAPDACENCSELCRFFDEDLSFPRFCDDLDIIKYRNGIKEEYGICHFNPNENVISNIYVIPLKSDYIKRRKFHECFIEHDHIDPCFARLVSADELSPEMLEDYQEYKKYFETTAFDKKKRDIYDIWHRLYSAAKSKLDPRVLTPFIEAGGVAAAILTEKGNIYTGVCIDTCSSLGMCAERNAVANMITNGENKIVKLLCIMSDGSLGSPCGACREFLMQLHPESPNIEIMRNYKTREVITLGELMTDWWGEKRMNNQ